MVSGWLLDDAVGVAGGVGEAGASGVAGVAVAVGTAVGGSVAVKSAVADGGGGSVGLAICEGSDSATTSVTGMSERAQARLAIRTAIAGRNKIQAEDGRLFIEALA
jgi:hypothetical protein